MSSYIDLDAVSLRYGGATEGTLALSGATIQADRGEFVGVVGPSGCGKSTLLKVITGLWPPTHGTVIVDGKHVTGPLDSAGMTFQNPTLLPWRTTLDNVADRTVDLPRPRLLGPDFTQASLGLVQGLRDAIEHARHEAVS